MKHITIAEILHHAADHCLSTNVDYPYMPAESVYSCCAVMKATETLIGNIKGYEESDAVFRRVEAGLEAMGVDTESFKEFNDVPCEYRQGARYLWLKFAALMAEEQGV